jgi:hypothetical protein
MIADVSSSLTSRLTPTAEWTAQQMLEAFPFDGAPKYLLRDRDRIFAQEFAPAYLSLNEDSPDSRSVQSFARIIGSPEVGGLHLRYERIA